MEDEGSNDLLIFKLRGHVSGASSSQTALGQDLEAPSKDRDVEVVKPQKDELPDIERKQLSRARYEASAKQQQKQEAPKTEVQPAVIPIPPKKEAQSEPFVPQSKPQRIKKQRSERVQHTATCINHPWRPAYATCEICRLNYCFADIMHQDGRYYCLKDVDMAVAETSRHNDVSPRNAFSIISSLLFLFTTVILFYYVYPDILFLLGRIAALGISPTSVNLSTPSFYLTSFSRVLNIMLQYQTASINLIILIFGFIAGLIILKNTELNMVLASVIDASALAIISYQYLSSPNFLTLSTAHFYLASISVLLFINLAAIALSRSSGLAEAVDHEATTGRPAINWPGAEGTY